MQSDVRICMACWNVFQIKPSPEIDLSGWMNNNTDSTFPHSSVNIYVISLQEVTRVDNVNKDAPPVDQSLFTNWNSLLQTYINSMRTTDLVSCYFTQNLGGNLLSIFVASSFHSRLSHQEAFPLELSRSKTTIKAGLNYRFQIALSSSTSYTIAVSGVHASADQEGDATEQRISDINRIVASSFPSNGQFINHDLCLLGGDFNFRVNLDRALIVDYSAQKNYQAILEHDQQCVAKREGKMMNEFTEVPITFPPTYKYLLGTQEFNTSEPPHKRNPAYTDRIVFRERESGRVQWHVYGSGSLTLSDHKPIFLLGSIKVD